MPELPEVETIKRTLAPRLLGRRILGLALRFPGMLAGAVPEELGRRLSGQVIGGVDRRGKYLLLELAAGDRLAFHLRMTGRLLLRPADHPDDPHTRLVFPLSEGWELRYADLRKFGRLHYLPAGEPLPDSLAALGPEPLGEGFTPAVLEEILAGRRGALKAVLLDQRSVSGIGNIYADEILHRARLHPARHPGSLSREEIARLHAAIRTVLQEAILARGTTSRDYLDGEGRPGDYQERLSVYGRAGRACPGCGAEIRRMVLAGRGTHYCPVCQT